MKLIFAIVRPLVMERLINALEDIEDFPGITIADVEGFGRRLRTDANEALNPFKPKKQIEIVCRDEIVEKIVTAIRENAHTGKKGDGIIWTMPVEETFLL